MAIYEILQIQSILLCFSIIDQSIVMIDLNRNSFITKKNTVMKKQMFLLVLASSIWHTTLFAQKARFGIQAGPTFSNIVVKAVGGEQETSDMKIGFTAGFMLDKPISDHFIFQPALNFVQKGSSVNESDYKSSATLNYIELPLNFLYRQDPSKGFFAGIGPSIGVGIYGEWKDDYEKESIHFGNDEMEDDFMRMDFGGNLLAGYLFANGLQITANFNKSLSNLVIGEYASDFKIKNNYFSLRVGYFFNTKK